jgi:hypothetical protein
MGVLMLMAMAAPSAHAFLVTYYNFNTEADGTTFPFTSNTTAVPGTQQTHLVNDATNAFPGGVVDIDASAGTTLNHWPGGPGQPEDVSGAGGALDLSGNANSGITKDTSYCFDFGGISTTGKFDVSLSFAIASVGNAGQFDTLTVEWGTSASAAVPAASYPNSVTLSPFTIGLNTSIVTYQQVTGALGAGADDLAAGTFVWIQFCFSGSGNNANGNDTFLDNVSVTAVPEPSSYIGGLLGLFGLCWYQRRWFMRLVGLRPA